MFNKIKTFFEDALSEITSYKVGFFNKYWWDAQKDKFLYFPAVNRRLMKGFEFYTFDITDSSIELLFKQFKMFWEDWGYQKADKAWLNELLEHKKRSGFQQYDNHIEQMEIYDFIVKREYNKQLYEKISSEYHSFHKMIFVPVEEEYNGEKCSQLEIEVLPGAFEVKYTFVNKILFIEKIPLRTQLPKGSFPLHDLEYEMFEQDSEYAQRIIKVRGALWD